jgi:pantoate--beta-alanine ligase
MQITTTKESLHRARAALKGRVAFVPTMGALHAGHLSLIHEAKKHADHVIASIFVNPTQFGPNEDFSRYPRTLEADIAMLREADVALLYTPDSADMYDENAVTSIHVSELEHILCGKFRSGHFAGVATVVAKLFMRVAPDVALFGEKDFQQLLVIQQLVRDLDIPTEIIGVPTMREADGLAMSSRNRYLSVEERKIASQLYATLNELKNAPTAEIPTRGRELLLARGFTKVDYVETYAGRLLAAAWLGTTRLIDNVAR